MNKDNILFAIIGVLLGCIIGFVFANTINQRGNEGRASSAPRNSNLPPDHPQVPMNGVAEQGGAPPAAVTAAIQKARNEPDNFDAQLEAAQLFYQINRFKEATDLLLKANQLRPDDYVTKVALGDVNFEAGDFPTAEKWYTAALAQNPDDVNVRTDLGLSFFLREPPDVDRAIKEYQGSLGRDPKHEKTLQNLTAALIRKGEKKDAEATLAKLEEVNASNEAISKLRSDLQALSNTPSSSGQKKK